MTERVTWPVYILAALLAAAQGCLEITVRTEVLDDGSVLRAVSVRRTEKTLPPHAYPLSTDPSWSGEWRETGDKDQPYEYTARKSFASPSELAEEYPSEPAGAVGITASLDRRSGWFFTTFDYREVYTLRNPFRRVGAAEFFTPEEIARIGRGERNDTLNMRVEQWDYRNVFEEYFARLKEEIGAGDRVVNPASLDRAKERLFELTREDTAANGGSRTGPALRILGKALGAPAAARYEPAVGRAIDRVDSMQNARKSADVWTSILVMPGTLLASNADSSSVEGLRWSFEAKRLLVAGVEMTASSRATNITGFVVTAGALLLLLVPVVLALRRRRAAA